ncbi:hypothetical protein [Alicyclobacillus fodiniaquatilis]|uniref:Uncharacterized protein n=1 Tax=Alicyclobacillus fodiniaquatilis TaxID=1661150 RepID=A0ABW4JGQ0_9BACL
MAKYYPTFSCWHQDEVVLFGPEKERDRKLQWFRESGLCPQCYKAKQVAEVERGSEGLPPLSETDKQIQWAEKIRVDVIGYVKNKISKASNTEAQKEGFTKIFLELCDSKTEAKWWIDNRDGHSTMKMLWPEVIRIAKERQLG